MSHDSSGKMERSFLVRRNEISVWMEAVWFTPAQWVLTSSPLQHIESNSRRPVTHSPSFTGSLCSSAADGGFVWNFQVTYTPRTCAGVLRERTQWSRVCLDLGLRRLKMFFLICKRVLWRRILLLHFCFLKNHITSKL